MNKRQAKKEYYYGEYLGIRRYNQALGVSRYQYLKECTRDLTEQYGIERHMEECYKLRIHTLDRLQNKGRKMIRWQKKEEHHELQDICNGIQN